ncbi:hypothetical protein ABMY26_06650 (plasmid) [Azospirillum sp. HJ39]|uniref:hypothetical protein n=1 Tax=Azospirillum sp. HJ39 TaxID=3159496 RepID=UPI003556CC2E
MQHGSLAGAKITLINYGRPLTERAKSRKVVGPYYFTVPQPNGGCNGVGLFFYMGRHNDMDQHGSAIRLRVEDANKHLRGSRLSHTTGYYSDRYGHETIKPIIARLPRGRGFLAGWTMGEGMASSLDPHIWADAEDAARAAHDEAERAAEREQEHEDEESDDEEEDDSVEPGATLDHFG